MALIVKREGHKEAYDDRKAYASCYAAVLNVHKTKEEAEQTCAQVTAVLQERLRKNEEVTSDELFKMIAEIMKQYDADAAFMYKTHRDLS